MSHSLGLHVCVEGIETEGELTKAKQTEPDYIQGFLFGKPCSRAEGFPDILRAAETGFL